MTLKNHARVEVPEGLLEAIRSFPLERPVGHCGVDWKVSPFDFYTQCPECGSRIKLRSFSSAAEIEDVFDAVFEWISRPGAAEAARHRQEVLEADRAE